MKLSILLLFLLVGLVCSFHAPSSSSSSSSEEHHRGHKHHQYKGSKGTKGSKKHNDRFSPSRAVYPKTKFDSSSSSGSSEYHHRPQRPRPYPPNDVPETTTDSGPKCESGWLTFNRPQGRWCVKVIPSIPNGYSWYAAQTACESIGAMTSGLQNNEERLMLAEEGRRIIQANGQDATAIWIGARRRSECKKTGDCGAMNTFYWYDGYTSGSDGIKWAITQPDGQVAGNGAAQDCIQQFIFPNSTTHKWWPNINHGEMDDQWCSWTNGPDQRLYACGKKAV